MSGAEYIKAPIVDGEPDEVSERQVDLVEDIIKEEYTRYQTPEGQPIDPEFPDIPPYSEINSMTS